MKSNETPEIPDRGKTSDIPGLPSEEVVQQIALVLWMLSIMT